MSEERVQRGYLVLADITGYSAFFAGSELEHAQGIVEDLLLLDPGKKALWQVDLDSARHDRRGDGRGGVGATLHCAHGDFTSTTSFLDWKPFEYFTFRTEFRGPSWRTPPPAVATMTLERREEGTSLTGRVRVEPAGLLARLLLPLLLPAARSRMEEEIRRLDDLLQREAAAPEGSSEA